MIFRDKFSEFSDFSTNWRRLLTRGGLMLFIGIMLAFFAVFKPDVMVLNSRDTSWLPICGFIVLIVGLLECFDALISKELKDFFISLQNGLLDLVVAGLIIFNVGAVADKLYLLIAAFLLIKGAFRFIVSYVISSPNIVSARTSAAVAVVLGVLIAMQWPFETTWFLAFSLSIEIALRGWGIMMIALWLQSQQQPN